MFNLYRDFDMPGYPPKSGPSVVMVSIEIGVRSRLRVKWTVVECTFRVEVGYDWLNCSTLQCYYPVRWYNVNEAV